MNEKNEEVEREIRIQRKTRKKKRKRKSSLIIQVSTVMIRVNC